MTDKEARQLLDRPAQDTSDGSQFADDVVVSATSLSKTYPTGTQALDDLALEIHRGECFGLLGPNGAGKSTTVGILTTRIAASSGVATVAGYDVVREMTAVRRRIGLVAQTNTLDSALSVSENLYYHGRYFGMGRAEAVERSEAALGWASMTDRRDERPRNLSGGMSRRIVVARALMHDPDVVFLDEPSAGLDPLSRLAVYDMIDRLRADHVTTVLTTHYLEEADRLCDRIAVIDRGRLLVADTPKGLRSRVGASAEAVLTISGDATQAAAVLRKRLGESVVSVHVDKEGIRILAPDRTGLFASVTAVAAAAGVDITDLSIDTPSLESVFVLLTGREARE